MSEADDDKPIRAYVKRDNPFHYKQKEYYNWYYHNILMPAKRKMREEKKSLQNT